MTSDQKVTCKRCGRPASADSFILDPLFKMLVCPECVREQKAKSKAPGTASNVSTQNVSLSILAGAKPSRPMNTASTVRPKASSSTPSNANPSNVSLSILAGAKPLKTSSSVTKTSSSISKTSTPITRASTSQLRPVPQKVQEVKERPPGWDSEDDYLERAQKQKAKLNVNYERLDDFRVKYMCTKCKYKFVYYTERRYPSLCPYCGTKVLDSSIR